VKCIKTSFVFDEQINDDTGRQPYTKTENVDEGKKWALPDVTKSNGKIISDHGKLLGYYLTIMHHVMKL
jgi:hypothetical protein